MANISIVQHIGTTTSASTNPIILNTATTGANNLLVVGFIAGWQATIGSVTAGTNGTNNFTQFKNAYTSDLSDYMADVWYLPKSKSGKTTITLTCSGTSNLHGTGMEFWEISGFNSSIIGNTTNVKSGLGVGTTCTGSSLKTISAKEFLIGLCAPVVGNITGGSTFTSGGDLPDGYGMSSLITNSVSIYTPVWTNSNSGDTFTSLTSEFKEAVVISKTLTPNGTKIGSRQVHWGHTN